MTAPPRRWLRRLTGPVSRRLLLALALGAVWASWAWLPPRPVNAWGMPLGDIHHRFVLARDGSTLVTASGGAALFINGGVSGGPRGPVRLWDMASGRERLRVVEPDTALAVADPFTLAPDGSWLLTQDRRRGLVLWDTATGQRRAKLWPSVGYPDLSVRQAVAVAPDGRTIARGFTDDPAVQLWESATGQRLATLVGSRRPLAFTPDGRALLTATAGTAARLWDVATGRVLFDLPGHLAPVNAVAVSPDGRRLATAVDSEGRDQLAPPAVKLWDAGTGKLLATIDAQVPLGGYFALDFSPDGAFLVIRSALCRNALWDVTTDPPQYRDDLLWLTERDPSGHLYLNSYRLWFAPDGRQWWVGLAEERSFARLDRSGLPRILIRLDRPWHGGQFVFTPDGRTIAVPVFYDVNEADVSPVRRHVLRWKRAVLGKPGHGFLSSVQLFAADSGRLLAALPECDEDNFQVLGFAADGRTLWTTHVVRSGAGDRRVFQQWAVPTGWPPVWLLAVTALVVLLAVVDWRRRVAILKTG